MSKQASAGSGKDNFTRWLVIGMVALVVVTGVVFSMMSSSTKANESFDALDGYTLGAPVSMTLDSNAGAGLLMNPGAPVRIDIWEDPQCPSCRAFESSLGTYIETMIRSQRATVAYHVLSFLGPESVRTANAMMCAADESQYLDFQRSIYVVQPALQNSGFYSNENLIKIGEKIGIKSEKFKECVTNGAKLELVKTHADSMAAYNVKGTPTVFINGKVWQPSSNGFDENEFRLAVEAG